MAEVAVLAGDPARANILAALMGGRAVIAAELLHAAGLSLQTTSRTSRQAHRPVADGLRQTGPPSRYYIVTPCVAEMPEGIMAVLAQPRPRHRPRRSSTAPCGARASRPPCRWQSQRRPHRTARQGRCGDLALADDGDEVTGISSFQEFGTDLAAARSRRPRPRLDRASAAPWRQRRRPARTALRDHFAQEPGCFTGKQPSVDLSPGSRHWWKNGSPLPHPGERLAVVAPSRTSQSA
jgi:hypothetical protein